MNTSTSKKPRVGLGFNCAADAFQRGREAAQMAKSQLAEEGFDLAVALGPGDHTFQDFVEGVRLVIGTRRLIAIPNEGMSSNGLFPAESSVVVMLQNAPFHITLAAIAHDRANPMALLSHLRTDIRRQRGGLIRKFRHQGMIFVDNYPLSDSGPILAVAAADAGLRPWCLMAGPLTSAPTALTCADQILLPGIMFVEVLSQTPCGISTVGLDAFPQERRIAAEALKAAYRKAVEQMAAPPLAGVVIHNFVSGTDDPAGATAPPDGTLPNDCPILCFASRHHILKPENEAAVPQKRSVAVLLFPSS